MSLQSRRSRRPRGQAGLAPVGDIPGEPITDALAALPDWDGFTWPQPDFTGASDISVMPGSEPPYDNGFPLPSAVTAVKETQPGTRPEPEPEPEPDIPLSELAAWVETCTEEAARTLQAGRERSGEAHAAFELSLDAHVTTARKHITEHAANWAETIKTRCGKAMTNPDTEPSPREAIAS